MKSVKLQQALRIGTLSLMLGGLFGCGSIAQSGFSLLPSRNFPITKIQELQEGKPNSSTVYLEGEVVKKAPFLGTGAYELKDSTGSIWVVTKEKIPNQQNKVLLKGKVLYKNISVGGTTLKEVYVEEEQRL